MRSARHGSSRRIGRSEESSIFNSPRLIALKSCVHMELRRRRKGLSKIVSGVLVSDAA
jgi:hypothetical protein